MSRVEHLGIAACALACATPAWANQPTPGGAGACAVVVYSANPRYPPYHWAEQDDGLAGASVELLSLVMPRGTVLKAAVYPWKRTLLLAREGSIDLLLPLRDTPERREYLAFASHRAFPNPIVVFVRKDRAFAYRGWADLKGRKGGISLGDTFGAGFDEYWPNQLEIETAPSLVENFRKLDAGNLDYFVTGLNSGLVHLAGHPPRHEIVALQPPVSDQDITFAFAKRSRCLPLLEQVSRKLEALDQQGVPERLLAKELERLRRHPVELGP